MFSFSQFILRNCESIAGVCGWLRRSRLVSGADSNLFLWELFNSDFGKLNYLLIRLMAGVVRKAMKWKKATRENFSENFRGFKKDVEV